MLETSEKQAYLAKRPGFGGVTRGSFSKGGRKNPGKVLWDGVTFRDACRAEASKCLQLLKKARDSDEVPWAIRVQAANALLDRAFGKAVQQLEVAQVRPLAELPWDELRAEIAALRGRESAREPLLIEGELSTSASEASVVDASDTTALKTPTSNQERLSCSVSPPLYPAEHPVND